MRTLFIVLLFTIPCYDQCPSNTCPNPIEPSVNSQETSYIYLISHGQVITFFQIKGNPSFAYSKYDQYMSDFEYYRKNRLLTPPKWSEPNHDRKDDVIYFYTVDGNKIEWKGDFLLSEKHLNVIGEIKISQ